jgi:hypothetical protein
MLGTTEWLHKLWPLEWYSAPYSYLECPECREPSIDKVTHSCYGLKSHRKPPNLQMGNNELRRMVSSGMLHRVAPVRTDVSEERSTSIISVTISPQRASVAPPLWSSGQSSWLLTQRSRIRFLALPQFLSSSGCGTGSTQPL